MFWLDPARGRHRRALLEEKVGSLAGDLTDGVAVAGRDLGHRAQGMGHQVRSWFKREPVADSPLRERVRSALGRAVSHPKAIDVTANNGRITLSGAVLAREYEALLDTVCAVRGVHEVDEQLAVHDDPHGIPELQGGNPRGRARIALRGPPTPAGRLLAGSSGGSMLLFGLWQLFGSREHRLLASGAVAMGSWLLLRSVAGARRPSVRARWSVRSVP